MLLGARVLAKVDNKVKECRVIDIQGDNLQLEAVTGEIISRKYWQVNGVKNEQA